MGSSAGDLAPYSNTDRRDLPHRTIRDATTLQSGGHVHGKVVVTL